MPDDILAKYCSPTILGFKTGSMFTYCFKSDKDKKENIRRLNQSLSSKGLRVVPLRQTDNKTLIYMFRPSKLKKDLTSDTAQQLLKQFGYQSSACGQCIARLVSRINETDSFPHEVGLFLGYPPEDVCGFIENKAANYKCCGLWKVYGDEHKALQTFEKYKKCTKLCCSLIAKGCSVEQLAVSC